MTISISSFDAKGVGAANTLNTNSKLWVLNRLYLVTVYNFIGTGSPTLPTISGLTQQKTRVSVSDSRQRLSLFSFLGDGATNAKTYDFGGTTQTYIETVVDEVTGSIITGTNGSDAFVQIVSNDGGPTTTYDAALAAFASGGNATWFGVGNGTAPATIKAGFTALSQSNVNLVANSEYLASSDTAPNMTGGSAFWTSIGVELAAASTVIANHLRRVHPFSS